ncbi:MAG TPA: DUF4350 domain-containing protein [Candidatus Udaeobacter sp.]|nr:DUF4350 domain-containing protein [Candidatus Udaeobacter sp.]
MKGARGWFILVAIAVIVAAAAYALQPHQDSPEHSTNSDAANGASAALLYAEAMGHPAAQIAGGFDPQQGYGMMFVFTPTSPFTAGEAQRALAWVRGGGVLVYASEQGDSELDKAFGVTRMNAVVAGGTETATPVVTGVNRVAGADALEPLDVSSQQVVALRARGGSAAAFLQRVGAGTAVVIADPLVLCNGYLDKDDNGIFLADLLALAPAGSTIAFDEYHHGLTLTDIAPQEWVTSPWGAGLLWLLVAVFVGLMLRGRRFGPVVERPVEAPRSDIEWAQAVGRLLRRSSARTVTLGLLAGATERAVASYTGLPVQPRERFWQALWVRAPEVAAELAAVESSLQTAATESDVVRTAQRLQRLAHPVSPANQRKR